jgi:pimeloyl-ACP methyl ester carboxylesterase
MPAAPQPFEVHVSDAELEDLRRRLGDTRWPDRETVPDWSQGVPLHYLQTVCAHWRDSYDWRACEARLNALPQFRMNIDGVDIHFLHVRSGTADATPMVMTHGWPGSVVEFLDVIDALVDPMRHGGRSTDAFHLVVPSLPGFGFSSRPTEVGWNRERVADAWVHLMSTLGYDRFIAQGGDWGASVSNQIAIRHPGRLLGVHVNLVSVGPPVEDPSDLTEQEAEAVAEWQRVDALHSRWEVGYMHQQRTRPQTLGYGLADSPAGQCAWILEKFRSWSDCGDDPVGGFGIDRLLDNISLYWLTATATSSARFYWECQPAPFDFVVDVPAGATIYPKEIRRPRRQWAERVYRDLRYWNEVERGGHFAAFEVPGLFVDELRRFARALVGE